MENERAGGKKGGIKNRADCWQEGTKTGTGRNRTNDGIGFLLSLSLSHQIGDRQYWELNRRSSDQ